MAKRRKRGDGGVSLRKDGRWEGRAVIGYDDKGLPITKNVLAKTKSECTAKLKALQDSIKAPALDRPKPGILLSDWLDIWYQSYKKPNLRPNTQMSYERRIYQHIIPKLGGIQLDKLTTSDIQQFYADLKLNGRLLRVELTARVFPTRPSEASTPPSMRHWIKPSRKSSYSATLRTAAVSHPPKPERCRCWPRRKSSVC